MWYKFEEVLAEDFEWKILESAKKVVEWEDKDWGGPLYPVELYKTPECRFYMVEQGNGTTVPHTVRRLTLQEAEVYLKMGMERGWKRVDLDEFYAGGQVARQN